MGVCVLIGSYSRHLKLQVVRKPVRLVRKADRLVAL